MSISLHRVVSVLLLLALFAQLLLSVELKSPTIDEPNHLARGYGYLETGDPRMSRDEGHPVLLNLLCALPLRLFPDMPQPEQFGGWHSGFRNAFAAELVFSGAVPVRRLFFVARLPVMMLTLCLAALAGQTPQEFAAGKCLTCLNTAYDWRQRDLQLVKGKISFVRLVRKSGRITLTADDKFEIGETFQWQYVLAQVDVAAQQLNIFLNDECIKSFDYQLR